VNVKLDWLSVLVEMRNNLERGEGKSLERVNRLTTFLSDKPPDRARTIVEGALFKGIVTRDEAMFSLLDLAMHFNRKLVF